MLFITYSDTNGKPVIGHDAFQCVNALRARAAGCRTLEFLDHIDANAAWFGDYTMDQAIKAFGAEEVTGKEKE